VKKQSLQETAPVQKSSITASLFISQLHRFWSNADALTNILDYCVDEETIMSDKYDKINNWETWKKSHALQNHGH
jgi:hypothetical protein